MKFILKLSVIVIFIVLFTASNCKKESDEKPEITGCNTWEYKGYNYPLYEEMGCNPSASSEHFTYSGGGQPYSFDVECTNGCISSLKLLE